MNQNDRVEIEKATKAVRLIDEMTATDGFQAYAAKLDLRAEEMATSILEKKMTAEEREELRQQRLGLLSALRMIQDDREGHVSILRNHGIEV